MKLLKIFVTTIVAVILFQTISAQSQDTATKFQTIKVNGECSMCKHRIEKAAMMIDGIQSAIWDVDAKTLTVKYKLSNAALVDSVQKKIAVIGHDTEKYAATDAAYNSLPECCHYKRKLVKQ